MRGFRYFLSIALLISASFSCLAREVNLSGNWRSAPVRMDDEGMSGETVLQYLFVPSGAESGKFTEVNSMTMDIVLPMEEPGDISIRMDVRIEVSGTYVIRGDELRLSYEYRKAKAELVELEMSAEDPEVNGRLDNVKGMVKAVVAKPMVKALRNEYKDMSGVKTGFSVGGDEMTFIDEDGETYIFHRE